MEKNTYVYPRKVAIIRKQQNFQNKRIPKVKAHQTNRNKIEGMGWGRSGE